MIQRKIVTLVDGRKFESLAEFNDDENHIIETDGCYVLVVRDEEDEDYEHFVPTPYLFPEALKVLKKLPLPKAIFSKAVEKRLAEEADRRALARAKR